MKKITLITNTKKGEGGANVAGDRLIKILKKNFRIETRTIDKKNLIGKIKYYIARVIIRIFIGKTDFLNSLNIFTRVNLKNIKTDLVLINWIGEETLSLMDLRKINKPIVWTLQDMWATTSTEHFLDSSKKNGYSKKDTKGNLIKNQIYKKKFFLYDKKNINIITNSKWLENFSKKSDLTKRLNTKTIYNPIKAENWFRESEHNSKLKLNLDPKVQYILYGANGGLKNFRKGGDLFLEAISKIRMINKKLEVIILGGDQNYVKKVNNINFHYRKFNSNIKIQRLYHSSSILTVCSSRGESLPQFIVETILCKNPVVSFDLGGMREIISHKFNGYLVKCYDTKDFAKGIKYCIKNIKKNNLLKSRNTIYNMFEEKKALKEYTNFINKII
jgi:glycosyltransferase involved in cell wall biosynthesis